MSAQVSRHHNEFNGGLPTVLLVDVEDGAPDIPPPPAIACRQGEVPDPGRGEGEGLQGGVGVPPPDDVFSRVLLKYMKVISVQIGFKSILLIVHFCRWQSITYLYIFMVLRPVPQVDQMEDVFLLFEDQVLLSHRRQPCHGGDWQWPGQGPGGCLLLPDDFI